MPPSSPHVSPLSAAATSARRLSQRSTEELLRRVLAQLAAQPERLADLLAGHPDPLIAFSPDRQILVANGAAEQLFGYGRGALDGQTTDLLVPPALRQPEAPPMQPLATLTTIHLPGQRLDGSQPELAWTFGTVTTPSPVFVMVIRDRAEIDDALEALHASEQRFRLLVEGVRDHAVFLLDAEGRISTWNSGAERIKGWRAEEIIGQHYETFFPSEDRVAGVPAQNLARAIEHGHHEVSGWRMRKDGSRFYAEASIWALVAPDGTLQGFAKVTHDLTEKRAAEDARRRLEIERAARQAAEAGRDQLARLHRATQALSRATSPEQVVAAVLESLAQVDAAGGALYMVDADEGLLRLAGGQGHPPGFLDSHRTIPLGMRTPACDVVTTREALLYESAEAVVAAYPAMDVDKVRAGGLEASVTLPLIARETTIGVIVIRYRQCVQFTDSDRSLLLTMAELCAQALERARLFEAEREARTQAEAASRAKDEFLAMLGHELRNPLAPIATAVELMKLRGETHSLREREVIERQLAHITRLVDDLLDIARITRGKLELSRVPLDVADVVARALEMASPLLEQRHHRVTLAVPRQQLVLGDPARLAQVVSNLLSNAAKYTPPGGNIHVEVTSTSSEVAIAVRDDGEGISPELLPHVFDLFVQGARTFDRAGGGLGIGLALVKNLVALHGGTVSARSEGIANRGSELTVRLPRLPPSVATGPSPASDRRALETSRTGKRVLVVDDNRDFAEMLASSLSQLGYQVTMASDAVAALASLRETPVDAAVLDLGLPVLDGFELATRIRAQFPTERPRLIAVTGYGQQHDRMRSASAGFDAHLVKPIDLSSMVAALERPAS